MASTKLRSALKALFLPGKIFGLAAFHFAKNGCETSKFQSAFCVLVLSGLSSLIVCTSVLDPIGTLYEEEQENVIEEAADNLEAYVSSLTMVVCVAFHFARKNKLCEILNNIQVFDDRVEKDNIPIDSNIAKRNIILGVTFVYIFNIVYILLEIVCFVEEETLLQLINYSAPALITSYVDLQFCALILLIRQRFAAINKYYGEHGDHWHTLEHKEFKNDHFKGRTPKKMYSPEKYIYENLQKRTEYIRRRHYELCEITNEINESYSPQLLLILTQSLITLISMIFFLASSFISSTAKISFYMHIYTTCVCIFCAIQIIAIIFVCVIITNESQKTAKMMFKKEYHLLRFKEFEHEIYFSVQLIHQKVHLEACKGLPITGPMLSTIIGTIITYLLIVIQFDINMETFNVHLSRNHTNV